MEVETGLFTLIYEHLIWEGHQEIH